MKSARVDLDHRKMGHCGRSIMVGGVTLLLTKQSRNVKSFFNVVVFFDFSSCSVEVTTWEVDLLRAPTANTT